MLWSDMILVQIIQYVDIGICLPADSLYVVNIVRVEPGKVVYQYMQIRQ